MYWEIVSNIVKSVKPILRFNFLSYFFSYNLLFYINPQLYGYSAICKVLLQNIRLKCEYESALNCISKDGNAVLARFAFDSVNPYEHMMVSVRLGHAILSDSILFKSLKIT